MTFNRQLARAFLGLALVPAADAAVTATARMDPPAVLELDPFTVALVVTNAGADGFEDVYPALRPAGSGRAAVLTAPAGPLRVAAGATATLYWTLRASGAGPVAFGAEAAGTLLTVPVTAAAEARGTVSPRTDGILVYPLPAAGDLVRVALYLPAGADEVTIEAFNGSFDRAFRGSWTALAPGRPEVVISGLLDWSPGVYLLKTRARLGDGTVKVFPLARAVVER